MANKGPGLVDVKKALGCTAGELAALPSEDRADLKRWLAEEWDAEESD